MNDLLLGKLRDLKLSGIIKSFDLRVEEAIKNNFSYQEFFEILINDEVSNRRINSNQKRTSKARFPWHKTLEEYNFSYQPVDDKIKMY